MAKTAEMRTVMLFAVLKSLDHFEVGPGVHLCDGCTASFEKLAWEAVAKQAKILQPFEVQKHLFEALIESSEGFIDERFSGSVFRDARASEGLHAAPARR
jgi:hypothetical protein